MAIRMCPRCHKSVGNKIRWSEGKCPRCRERTMYNADLCLHPNAGVEPLNKINRGFGSAGWCKKCGEILFKGERFYFSERYE